MTMHFDLALDELRSYRPDLTEPADLRDFWATTLDDAQAHDIDVTWTPYESPLRTVDVFDVRFSGFGGQRIAAWLLLPRQRRDPLPCIVQYVGYGGGRGLPHEWLTWSAMGFAHLVMDTRGQGSAHHPGRTPDLDPEGSPPHVPGFLTLGLPDPARHYYRRLFTDAVRAVEAAASHPDIDASRVVTAGGSQGGALSLAASILRGWLLADPPAAVLADVPFLCHFRRAAELASDFAVHRAGRVVQPPPRPGRGRLRGTWRTSTWPCSPGTRWRRACGASRLRDPICPPSTVFAAHNRYGGPADMRVWEWNEHEGGEAFQELEQVAWLASVGVDVQRGA